MVHLISEILIFMVGFCVLAWGGIERISAFKSNPFHIRLMRAGLFLMVAAVLLHSIR